MMLEVISWGAVVGLAGMAFRDAMFAAVGLWVLGLGFLYRCLAVGMPAEIKAILGFWEVVTFCCIVNFVVPIRLGILVHAVDGHCRMGLKLLFVHAAGCASGLRKVSALGAVIGRRRTVFHRWVVVVAIATLRALVLAWLAGACRAQALCRHRQRNSAEKDQRAQKKLPEVCVHVDWS